MKYTIDGVTFEGFTPFRNPVQLVKANDKAIVVVAWFEGEPELWLVESPDKIDLLQKMLDDQWGKGRVLMQTFYQ